MSDETRRPGSGDEGEVLTGVRARNHTTVLASERASPLRTRLEQPAPVEPSYRTNGTTDDHAAFSRALTESDEYVSLTREDDTFQSLDEIFGVSHGRREESPAGGTLAQEHPRASEESSKKDASSTVMTAGGMNDDFYPALDAFELEEPQPLPPVATFSPPKIVRSASTIMPPLAPEQPAALEDDLDPFAAMQDDTFFQVSSDTQHKQGAIDDLGGMLGDLPEIEEMPIVQSPPSSGAPKIVRSGEGGAANDRIIVPTPTPQAVPKVHYVPEVLQIPKEAEAMSESRDQIYWKAESRLIGFLVTYDHDPKGSYLELRQGRLMVSNQREDSGSCMVVVGDSVSPMHAIMRCAPGGTVQVLDQLSEAGTRVKHMGQAEEEFLSGEKSSLSHGDVVFFGERKFHVLLLVGEE